MNTTFDCCPRCEKPKGFAPPMAGVEKIVFTNTLCETCKKQLVDENLVFVQEVKSVTEGGKKVEHHTGNWMELDYSNFGAGGMLGVEIPASSKMTLGTIVFQIYMDIYNKSKS